MNPLTPTGRGSRRTRIRIAALAAATAGAVLFSAPFAAASQIEVRSGGSDELVPPPGLTCGDVVFVTEASFDPAGNPVGAPRFGSGPGMVSVHDVPFTAEPGIAVLAEVVTYDGHIGRSEQVGQWAQPAEQVRFQFLLDGVVQGETQLTPDIPDGQRSAWVISNLGSVVLDDGADSLRILHSGDTSQPNSLVVSGVCGHIEPLPVAETTITTTTTTTTTTMAPPVVVEPTVEPTIAPPAVEPEVLPAVDVKPPAIAQPALAATGIESSWLVVVGATLVAVGAGMSGARRRLERGAR